MECWNVLGVCIERQIDLGGLSAIAFGVVGLTSIYFAARQLRLGQRAQQVQIAIKLHEDFYSSEDLRKFLYRLDHSNGENAWRFDPDSFAESSEESCLDLLLLKLSFIGYLVHARDIRTVDLHWLKSEVAIILENRHVLDYLEWLHQDKQFPNHESFSGAAYLYFSMYGEETEAAFALKKYLNQSRNRAKDAKIKKNSSNGVASPSSVIRLSH